MVTIVSIRHNNTSDNVTYLPNITLETFNKLNSNIPEFIFTAFEVHYNFNLQKLIQKILMH